jgi:hypothetical protein
VAFATAGMADWGAGIFRGRNAPENAVFDTLDMLVNDEGALFKRGGSSFFSASDAGSTLVQVYDAYVQAGQRTLALSGSNVYALNGTTPVNLGAAGFSATQMRAEGIAGTIVAGSSAGVAFYGGSLKTSAYSTGTASVTAGSKTVTGSGTTWTGNVDVGMLIMFTGGGSMGVVASVDSTTQVTLRDNWGGATVAGVTYSLAAIQGPIAIANAHVAAVSTVPRLFVTQNNRAYYTQTGNPFAVNTATDYIELPESSIITGAVGLGSTVVLFTTAGAWAIENAELSPVDDFGNIQWAQTQINPNLLLWGEPGIAAYGQELIVPAVDDVFRLSPSGGVEVLSWGIRPILRSYVNAGYQPGLAVTIRGHYILPVVNGSTLIDVLVCRLDRPYVVSVRPRIWGYPWTRWSGGAGSLSYAVRVGSSSRSPKLLGLQAQRITDLTSVFDATASNSQDADGTNVTCSVTTRDFPTSDGYQAATVARMRSVYELVADGTHTAPTVTPAFSSDQDAGAFTTLTTTGKQGGGTGWGTSDGSVYQWARVTKRRNRIRFKLTTSGAAASFVLRTLELLIRPTGKR